MNISVRFTADLRRTFRVVRRLRRKPIYVLRCIGALGMLTGLLSPDQRSELAGFLAARRPGPQSQDGRMRLSDVPTVTSWSSE